MTFQQAMAATSRELNARATITCVDAFVVSNTPVMSFSVEEGGQVTLGSVTSSRYTLSLPNGAGEWLKNGSILGNRSLTGARVQIQIGVYHDGAWDWQNAGLFIVEKTSAPEFSAAMKLMGNDPIISLDRAYDDQLAYRSTTTLGDILTHIKSKGVTITGSLACNASAIVNFQPDWGEEPTIRDVLGYVLQLGGSLARCDRAGNITIAPANGSTTHAITTDKYTEFTDDERYFNFNRIKILPNGAKKDAAYVESYVTSAAESAANTLCLKDNPLFKTKTTTSYSSLSAAEEAAGIKNRKYYVKVGNKYEVVPEPVDTSMTLYYKANKSYNTATLQTMADGLKTALTGMSFRAITFKWRGDPTVLVGDKVTLTDTRGVSDTTVILQQSLRYEGGFSAEISCPIDLTAVTPATLTSSGAWTPPYFGTGTIDGSVIMPNSLTGTQFADGSITNSQIKGGTITGVEIADSTIKNSHFANGTISGSIFEAGTITGSKIDASTFTDGQISGSKITDSTLTNSKFVDGTIEGSKIKDSTLTNSKFVDGTIEGSKIKDSTITGSKINASTFANGQISGSKIDSSTLTNIPYAQIKDLDVTGDAIFRQSVVGDGTFYLDRLIVNSANIGTATIGELMVRDAQGKLHKVLIGTNGVVSSEEVKVDGQNLSNDAMMQVSQRLVWRQEEQPSAPFIGMIWMDTSLTPVSGKAKEVLKRCTAITPSVTWAVVQSNELHTNVIDVDDNGMNILTGGNLNLLSGGALNIKNLSGTDNVINMDNTGITISSTGKIDLQSTANLNVQNGGNLNVLSGGDIEVNNGGDINVASGGKITLTTPNDLVLGAQNITAFADGRISAAANTIDLSANNSINLTVKNAVSGGTNLLQNGRFQNGLDKWTANSGGGTVGFDSVRTLNGLSTLRFLLGAGQTRQYISQIAAIDAITNTEYTLSIWYQHDSAVAANFGTGALLDIWADSTQVASLGASDFPYVAGKFSRKVVTFTAPAGSKTINVSVYHRNGGSAASGANYAEIMLEKGTMATDWSPAPSDPASGVKTSYIDIATDHIDISTGGNLSLTGGNFNLTGGTGTKAIGMSTDRVDEYMMWAGDATPSAAPFSVKRDGSVKATKIQQEYSQSFWDMADYGTNGNGVDPFPAEFDFYIPSGYSVDFVKVSFKVGRARTFAKGAASGGGLVSGTGPSREYTGNQITEGSNHSHNMAHSHSTNAHSHGVVFGVTEKSTLATASTLKIDGTTIGTDWFFEPDLSGLDLDVGAAVSGSGWHKITIQPNNDARISCYLRIGLTPS